MSTGGGSVVRGKKIEVTKDEDIREVCPTDKGRNAQVSKSNRLENLRNIGSRVHAKGSLIKRGCRRFYQNLFAMTLLRMEMLGGARGRTHETYGTKSAEGTFKSRRPKQHL